MFENLKKQISEHFKNSPEACNLLIQLPVPAIISDEKGRVLDINKPFQETFGYHREEISSLKAWWAMACSDYLPTWTVDQGQRNPIMLAVKCRDGHECPVEYIESRANHLLLSLFLDQTEVRRNEEALKRVVTVSSIHHGKDLFESIARELSFTLQADYTFIGHLQKDEDVPKMRTKAVVADGELVPNFEYSLPNTPCEVVLEQTACVYPSNVTEQFPKDKLLQDLKVEGYVGTPLISSKEENIGILVALYRSSVKNPRQIHSILTVFAGRVGSEIERQIAQVELENRLAELQRWYDLTLDREERNAELKKEVNELLIQLDREPKYDV